MCICPECEIEDHNDHDTVSVETEWMETKVGKENGERGYDCIDVWSESLGPHEEYGWHLADSEWKSSSSKSGDWLDHFMILTGFIFIHFGAMVLWFESQDQSITQLQSSC